MANLEAGHTRTDADGAADADDAALMRKIEFRHYNPRSEELKKYIVETEPATKDLDAYKAEFDAQLADAEAKFDDPRSDRAILLPKKINWDLKAQLAPRTRVLERRTQSALLELVREKLAADAGDSGAQQDGAQGGEQLARVVAQAPQLADEDDDEEDMDEDA